MKEILGVNLYTMAEVGQILGVQRSTASKYVQQGKLKARTIGARYYVTEEGLKEFLRTTDRK